jgi:hypothetical protein
MHPQMNIPERDRLCILADDLDSEDWLFTAAIFAVGFADAEEDIERICTMATTRQGSERTVWTTTGFLEINDCAPSSPAG